MTSTVPKATKKKIIVGCDGTWLNSDNGFEPYSWLPWSSPRDRQAAPASNVTRICRALKSSTSDGVPQLIYYQSGIGASGSAYDHFVNGTTGWTLGEHVREAYSFIRANYAEGDEIYLFGFSRGSFTARSIAALIRDIGLLKRDAMEQWFEIYTDWEKTPRTEPETTGGFETLMFKSAKRLAFSPQNTYIAELVSQNLTRPNIPIQVVGCFDTVGTLGVPVVDWIKPSRDYAFVDTHMCPNVENCFHALSLDEDRAPFIPTLWENPDPAHATPSGKPATLRQCWFPGVHTNIGGGYADADLSNISLAWMITQVLPFLEFDPAYLQLIRNLNQRFHKGQKPPRSDGWAEGYLYDPMTLTQRLGGTTARSPGMYRCADPKTGKRNGPLLQNTSETIHPSVRVRMASPEGKGMADKGSYKPESLKGWELSNEAGVTDRSDAVSKGWIWRLRDATGKVVIELKEDVITPESIEAMQFRAQSA